MNFHGRILAVSYSICRLLDLIVELLCEGFARGDICNLHRMSIVHGRTQSMGFYCILDGINDLGRTLY